MMPVRIAPSGRVVHRLALALSPAQLAEMLAVRQATAAVGSASPILASHWPTYRALVRSGMVDWDAAPEPFGRGWRRPRVTPLGDAVMMHRVEMDLRRLGALPPEEEGEPE